MVAALAGHLEGVAQDALTRDAVAAGDGEQTANPERPRQVPSLAGPSDHVLGEDEARQGFVVTTGQAEGVGGDDVQPGERRARSTGLIGFDGGDAVVGVVPVSGCRTNPGTVHLRLGRQVAEAAVGAELDGLLCQQRDPLPVQ